MAYRARGLGALTVAASLALVAPAAIAAQDGVIDDTRSEGSLDITLSVPPLVRISGLDDLDLGTFQGTGLSGTDQLCVWSTTRAYRVIAEGDGTGGSFTLTGGDNGDALAYDVQWAATAGAGSGDALTSGTALGNQSTSAATSDCNGGANPNATVIVTVADTELASVTEDTYAGTLTLTVEPE